MTPEALEWVARFRRYMGSERRLSAHTDSNYARDLAALVKIEYRPLPQDDPKLRQPDISRARRLLKWEPRIDRHDGLKRTLAYFQKKVAAQRK